MLTRENVKLSVVAALMLIVGLSAPAVANIVYANNSDKVDGKDAVGAGASIANRKGKLVATSGKTGRLPNNIINMAPNSARVDGMHIYTFSHSSTNGTDSGVPIATVGGLQITFACTGSPAVGHLDVTPTKDGGRETTVWVGASGVLTYSDAGFNANHSQWLWTNGSDLMAQDTLTYVLPGTNRFTRIEVAVSGQNPGPLCQANGTVTWR